MFLLLNACSFFNFTLIRLCSECYEPIVPESILPFAHIHQRLENSIKSSFFHLFFSFRFFFILMLFSFSSFSYACVCGYRIISHFLFWNSIKGFLSIDIDVSELQVNQCNSPRSKEPLSANKYYNEIFSQIEIFHESNKCHSNTMLVSFSFFSSFFWIYTFITSFTLFIYFYSKKKKERKKKLFFKSNWVSFFSFSSLFSCPFYSIFFHFSPLLYTNKKKP